MLTYAKKQQQYKEEHFTPCNKHNTQHLEYPSWCAAMVLNIVVEYCKYCDGLLPKYILVNIVNIAMIFYVLISQTVSGEVALSIFKSLIFETSVKKLINSWAGGGKDK